MIIKFVITVTLIYFWVVVRSYRSQVMDERRAILPTQQTPVQTIMGNDEYGGHSVGK